MDELVTMAHRQHFFHRYAHFVSDGARLRLNAFTARFDHLKVALLSLNTSLCELNKYRARDFNLFRLLRVERYEVTTHSVVLADLLNPHGIHGQHCLFLRTFLHYCAEKFDGTFPRLHGDIATVTWFVDREKVTAYRNLDLVVSCPDLEFLLVIENKIDAGEQQDQLRRYAQWMQHQSAYFTNRALIYLTPQGAPSRTIANGAYFCLSYSQDIFTWLCKALGEVKSLRVKETVGQYVDIINTL
jgi:hypothetical protein